MDFESGLKRLPVVASDVLSVSHRKRHFLAIRNLPGVLPDLPGRFNQSSLRDSELDILSHAEARGANEHRASGAEERGLASPQNSNCESHGDIHAATFAGCSKAAKCPASGSK